MAKLIYVTNMSLDGYIEDERGAIDFFPLDDEVFRSHTDLLRSAGTFLYGRRLYEMMAVWETDATLAAQSDAMADFATAWQAADKVVYSTTLAAAPTANTRHRTPLRPRRSTRAEGRGQQRPHRRGCEPRGPGDRGRAGRRVPAATSGPSSSVGESRHCRPTRAPTSSSSMSADSETASYSSGTAPSGPTRLETATPS